MKYMPHAPAGPSKEGGTVVNVDQNGTTHKKANGLHPLFNNGTLGPPLPISTVRLAPIAKGVKMVVPMFPPNSQGNSAIISGSSFYQMVRVLFVSA